MKLMANDSDGADDGAILREMVMLIVGAVSSDDARLTSLTVGLDHDLMR